MSIMNYFPPIGDSSVWYIILHSYRVEKEGTVDTSILDSHHSITYTIYDVNNTEIMSVTRNIIKGKRW